MFSKLNRKFNDIPIAIKVTVWYTLLMTLLFACILGGAVKLTDGFSIARARGDLEKEVWEITRKPHKFKSFDDGIYFAIYNGSTLTKGHLPESFPLQTPPKLHAPATRLTNQGMEFFYLDAAIKSSQGGTTWVRGVMPIDRLTMQSHLFLLLLLIALPLFIVLTAVVGYKIIKKGFSPVSQISMTAQAIGQQQDLSQRIFLSPGSDEIHKMADSFNTMLDRIEASLERERRFSSDVSHELRTPVAVIMSESEYGKDYTTSVEEAKESFASIFGQSQRMTVMINQLLQLARLDKNANVSLEDLDLSTMINELQNEYQHLLSASTLQWETQIAKNVIIRANPSLLRQAVANYLDNAAKFTHTWIKVTLSTTNSNALICISDDGTGLTAAELAKIWDRLYQTENSRNKNEKAGLGLGLSLVKAIASLHKGRAWAESKPGKGCSFYLEIPKS